MHDYWLDSSCLIQSKNGAYAFETFPVVWKFLEERIEDGILAICREVGEELLEGNDLLADWAQRQKDKGAFINPEAAVQKTMTDVSDYVKAHYVPHQAADFLDGADPWLIANAAVHGGRIVTHEEPDLHSNIKKREAKIPDVAKHFDLTTLQIRELFFALGAKFL
jgi:hypothetical protein